MTSSLRHPVLVVAPDFHSPTGRSAVLLAQWSERHPVVLVGGREPASGDGELRSLAERCGVVHWHANLAHFPALLDVAASLHGSVPQIAMVHHVDLGEEEKVTSLEGVVDCVHVPSCDTAARVGEVGTPLPVVRAPYLVDGWGHSRPRRRGDDDRFEVGWCGTSHVAGDRKRVEMLVRAIALARETIPEIRLVVQGRVPQEVLELARSESVAVDLRPWVPSGRRARFYDGIDLYASVSTVEGGPLPVFEAAARGVPVATTPVGLAAELVVGGGALTMPVDDPAGQAAVLVEVGRLTVAEREEMGRLHREAARILAGPPAVRDYRELWARVGSDPRSTPFDLTSARRRNRSELSRDRVDEVRELLRRGQRMDALRELLSARPRRSGRLARRGTGS